MDRDSLDRQLPAVAALEEPLRRRLYGCVAERGEVSRDQAARALGISRALAAFHLDKLVALGLLEAAYRRLNRRRGPGAGRPSKLYRRSGLQLAVTVPERRYELAAALFAQALNGRPGSGAEDVLGEAARAFGARLGEEARERAGPRATGASLWRSVEAVLRAYGFEPYRAGPREVRLRNCPFDALTRDHRALVCGMNLALHQGMLKGLAAAGFRVEMEPRPGRCCVVFRKGRRAKGEGRAPAVVSGDPTP